MSRKGFTLIEMLVVIAIISMLMLLVVPAAGSVQKRAKRSACASNLRQIAMASLMYSAEHGGKLVATPFKDPNVYWFRQMYPYLKRDNENKTTRVFQCMEDRDALEAFHNQGTEWNSISYLLLKESPEWSYLSEIRSPSQSPQFIDAEITATADYGTPAKFEQKVKGNQPDWRHGDGVNLAYWDGSVRYVRHPEYDTVFPKTNQGAL